MASVMYYALQFENASVEFGGFNFMYFYLIGIGIIFLGALAFLANPQVDRLIVLTKYSVYISIPFLVSVFISLIIWVVNLAEPNVMIRGIFYSVYQIIAVMVAAVTLYFFGSKGIYLNLLAMVLTNMYAIIMTISQDGGIAEFFRQFGTLLSSGATDTGSMMLKIEMLGLTYSFGMYILYFLFAEKKKSYWKWFFIIACGFFFLVSFKRSAVLGLILALVIGIILHIPKNEGRRKLVFIGGIIFVVIGMGYIFVVKYGIWEMITEMFSIETSGRNIVFENLDPYYEFSPFYMGEGLGYVTKMLQTGNLFLGVNVTDLHNDFLRQYVEMGFWGYLLWIFSVFVWRIHYFTKRNVKLGVLAFINVIFCFGIYFTENAYFHYYTNINMSLLIMCYGFEEQLLQEKRISKWL